MVQWQDQTRLEVTRGIDFADYTFSDPDLGERQDPVQKWDVLFTGTREQIEVWPVPASNGQTLRGVGYRKFAKLVNSTDVCRLDDRLVVLSAAIPMLANQESKSAQLVAEQFQVLYARLKGRSKGASPIYRMGQGAPDIVAPRPFVVRVGGE
jgi:hypothetical protein